MTDGAYLYILRCADGSYYTGTARSGLERDGWRSTTQGPMAGTQLNVGRSPSYILPMV
jgi:hypothetical protein